MNRLAFVLVVIAFSVCGAACSSSSKKSSTPSPTTNASATTTTLAPVDAGSSPTLQVATNAKLRQDIVVDSTGKTVYVYVPDGSSTTSKVPAAVRTAWPAVTATASTTPSVGVGLNANKLTVNDGRQVVYNGHLLYTFQGDARAGVANGQGLGKVWYVISPAGTPIT